MKALLERVKKRRYGANIFAVGDRFAFKLETGLGAGLTLEVVSKHFLALSAIVEANLYEINATHGIYKSKRSISIRVTYAMPLPATTYQIACHSARSRATPLRIAADKE